MSSPRSPPPQCNRSRGERFILWQQWCGGSLSCYLRYESLPSASESEEKKPLGSRIRHDFCKWLYSSRCYGVLGEKWCAVCVSCKVKWHWMKTTPLGWVIVHQHLASSHRLPSSSWYRWLQLFLTVMQFSSQWCDVIMSLYMGNTCSMLTVKKKIFKVKKYNNNNLSIIPIWITTANQQCIKL